MSSGGNSSVRFDRIRGPRYDEVSVDPPVPVDSRRSLDELRGSDLARSSDPLPPPPLPIHPPVGPEFYHSESDEPVEALELKPVRRFIPDSVKNFFRGSRSEPQRDMPAADSDSPVSRGKECSPPASPSFDTRKMKSSAASSYRDPYGGSGSSYNSHLPMLPHDPYDSLDRRTHRTAMTYSERVEEYHMKYSYMKSWPGLLRILAIFELLLGAAVFACVCAYIHKDNEWFNMFGYRQPYDYGGGSAYGGYYYSGPKTPFILVVAGLAWLVTVILLVLGMTMYYRTILLDSHWWPLTEFGLNIALFILYLAAAIVYVNDANRGGLCSYPLFNNGINGAFCRVEGGQTAGMIFLFVTVLMYLVSAIVCLKLWRHEAARRYKEHREHEMKTSEPAGPKLTQGAVLGDGRTGAPAVIHKEFRPVDMKPGVLSGHIPAGHIPKPLVVPDYVAKYPSIKTDDERDRYKAVFNDQHSEYKDLHAEVQAVLKKFTEMDSVMKKLPRFPENQMEHDRICNIFGEYEKKKNDPAFLEKKERCEYLKSKLSHIKQKIQEYDKVMGWNDGYSK
ncbi:MARVEL domain-containing protein 2-like isoform X1 [Acipenser oxyrinchus oxyrinchus]|uniref:MARVEL domain-containing protein 2-like isoform X1 n=1 Tax=Acipenser oxyrinchus oxyrinchus TaxID=40147 RepID=A0AAD8GL30_ACIOX|nr:MARVEL domain-containing protein 2-like isoform X1 [Acipenser oxyrinchus oxyrinchus]